MATMRIIVDCWESFQFKVRFCYLSQFLDNVKRKLHNCGYSSKSELSEDLELIKIALIKLHQEQKSITAKEYIIELKIRRLHQRIGEIVCDLHDAFHYSKDIPQQFKVWLTWKQLDTIRKKPYIRISEISELEEKSYERYLRAMGVQVPEEFTGSMNTTTSDLTSKMERYEILKEEIEKLSNKQYPRRKFRHLLSRMKSTSELLQRVIASSGGRPSVGTSSLIHGCK